MQIFDKRGKDWSVEVRRSRPCGIHPGVVAINSRNGFVSTLHPETYPAKFANRAAANCSKNLSTQQILTRLDGERRHSEAKGCLHFSTANKHDNGNPRPDGHCVTERAPFQISNPLKRPPDKPDPRGFPCQTWSLSGFYLNTCIYIYGIHPSVNDENELLHLTSDALRLGLTRFTFDIITGPHFGNGARRRIILTNWLWS